VSLAIGKVVRAPLARRQWFRTNALKTRSAVLQLTTKV